MQKVGPQVGSLTWACQTAVKQGLTNILGLNGAVALIINFSLDAYEDDPAAFHNVLFSVFNSKTEILEKAIVKEFYELMNDRFQQTFVFDFATQMKVAKEKFTEKDRRI
jgi:hypothetical protein